jgi:NADPH:quinone reductase-like Zn-dependent oxidoreductase
MGGPKVDGPLLAMMLRKRLRLQATTLRSRSNEYKKDLTKRFSEHALELFKNGKYKVILDRKSFTLEEAQESHDYMETNVNIGKIILQVASEEENL